MIHVEQSVFDDVEKVGKLAGDSVALSKISATTKNVGTVLSELFAARPFTPVILPAAWAGQPSVISQLEKFSDRLATGVLRIAFWGATPANLPTNIPFILIPNDRGQAIPRSFLLHLTRAQLPGVTSIMPEKSKVFTEHVSKDSEIGLRLDKIFELAKKSDAKHEEKSMIGRLAASSVLIGAFQEYRANTGVKSTIKLQMGACEHFAAFSIKWTTTRSQVQDWSEARMPWKLALSVCDALWIHLMPESSEVEVIAMICGDTPERKENWELPMLGLDILSHTRIEAMKGQDISKALQQLTFNPLANQSIAEGSSDIVIRGASGKEKNRNGDNSYQVSTPGKSSTEQDHAKMSGAVQEMRDQISTLRKRLGEALTNEKAAESEIKSLEIQLKNARVQGNNGVQQELEATKRKLAESKAKENEMAGALRACVDQLKKAQNELKTLKRQPKDNKKAA